jgi:hypothetical protein
MLTETERNERHRRLRRFERLERWKLLGVLLAAVTLLVVLIWSFRLWQPYGGRTSIAALCAADYKRAQRHGFRHRGSAAADRLPGGCAGAGYMWRASPHGEDSPVKNATCRDRDPMQSHVEALFTHNSDGDLVRGERTEWRARAAVFSRENGGQYGPAVPRRCGQGAPTRVERCIRGRHRPR